MVFVEVINSTRLQTRTSELGQNTIPRDHVRLEITSFFGMPLTLDEINKEIYIDENSIYDFVRVYCAT
jgi:hypothetical protein